MLTDAILKEATAEAERFRLSLVSEDGEPHEFSKRFQRKMEKLIRRANHPIRYQVMRIAAAVVLAIVTLFGAVMAISPEARAAVAGWIRETFGIYVQYTNDHAHGDNNIDSDNNTSVGSDSDNNTQAPTKYEYHLAEIPAGYHELRVTEKKAGKTYLYVDDSGNILQFAYLYGHKSSNLFVKTEDYAQYSSFVNGWPADVYIALKENETSVVIWQDTNADVLFHIFAMADQNGLIAIAENVQPIS